MIGVTGGPGSGKTTVSRMFAGLGGRVVDADMIARDLLQPGAPCYDEVVKTFGGGILDRRGGIDREELGRLVFGVRKELPARRTVSCSLGRLNAILHPAVVKEIRRRLRSMRSRCPRNALAVLDAPLLFEAGLAGDVHCVVVVTARQETQIVRLMKGHGLTRGEAVARMASQTPLGEKVRKADFVVDGERPLKEVAGQVQDIWRLLKRRGRKT